MASQSFTGTLGGGGQNVLTSTRRKKDEPFGSGTPVPKPSNATRLGTSFTGSMARPQPRAAGTDPSFNSVNLSNGRQQFGRLGERAANQDIDNYNTKATAQNNAATASKQSEIAAYNTEADRLTGDYNNQLGAYNNAWSGYNNVMSAYNNNVAAVQTVNNHYNDYQFYNDVVHGSNPRNYRRQDYVYYLNKAKANYEHSQQWYQSRNPSQSYLFTGYFNPNTYTRPTVQHPNRPVLPDAPDPFVEQQQMKDALPDRIERQLAPGQREIVGGDLPPQVSDLSGDVFSQLDVPFRDLSSLNASEQQGLGAPKAYRVPSWYWTQDGRFGSGGGQTISPSEITNQNDTMYYIRNYKWVPKSELTPLY